MCRVEKLLVWMLLVPMIALPGCFGSGSETARQPTVNGADGDGADDGTLSEDDEPRRAVPTQVLRVGDVAPPLAIGSWMTGEPVRTFQPGMVYVVEFWATWCGHCLAGMPHLSDLQTKFAEQVRIVGVSDEDRDRVAAFLRAKADGKSDQTWEEVIRYAIAVDTNRAETTVNYREAARQMDLPAAFIVGKDGHIEWIGHPMHMDGALEQVVLGTWDRQAAAASFQSKQRLEDFLRPLNEAVNEARESGDWQPALQVLEDARNQGVMDGDVDLAKLDVLWRADRFGEMKEVADKAAASKWNDGRDLNEIAWKLITRVPLEHRDLDQAQRIAERANELFDGQNASTLDTIARIYFERRDFAQAIRWQQKAIDADPINSTTLRNTLEQYEAAQSLTP